MERAWQAPVTTFALFNLIGVPLIGQIAWLAMEGLRDGAIGLAVLVSVLTAMGIAGGNLYLTLRARWAGVPPGIGLVLWAVTVLTFVLPIGTPFFSPLMLAWALVAW